MPDPDDGEDVPGAGLSPEDAFSILGDGTRLAILRGLWEADGPLSFSALRERVGSPDGGLFNYHLGELTDHFVRRTDGGYELRQPGLEVVRAVLAGAINERPSLDPIPVGGACPRCGSELTAEYDDHVVVRCADSGHVVMYNEFPPAGFGGRTPEGAFRAFDRWTRARFRLAFDGVCPSCAAPTRLSIVPPDGGENAAETADRPDEPTAEYVCGNCGNAARTPLSAYVLGHPAVACFYYEHGVEVEELPYPELRSLADDHRVTVPSTDPWRVEVAIRLGGDELRLVLDDDLSVVGTDRGRVS